MAYAEAQRVEIRFYLGWSARFHQFDSRLEQAMNAVDTELDTQAKAEVILAALADVMAKLTDAHSRLKALKVGSIELPGKIEIAMLRAEGRRHAGALAALHGVEVRHDVFGSGRYRYFATSDGLVHGSNLMLQG